MESNAKKNIASYLESNQKAVEVIKLAVGSLHYAAMPVQKTYSEVVEQLFELYEQDKNTKYLCVAVLYIKAYLEMGYDYAVYESIFNKVLDIFESQKNDLFPCKYYTSETMKLSRASISKALGHWRVSKYNSDSKQNTVNDIYEKIKVKEHGTYYYNNNDPSNKYRNSVFELVINEYDIFLHDVLKHIYYIFCE